MTTSFADDLQRGVKNHVENVAVVGVGGRSGSFIANALIHAKKHKVTAITRPESTSKMPSGLHDVKKIDYKDHASIVKALEGQDALVITMDRLAPPESQTQLIDAAVEAGVRWIVPNEYGVDQSKAEMGDNTTLHDRLEVIRKYIEKIGRDKTQWIGICCGFWYEFSLAGTEARYGFDFDKKTLTLYDDGKTKTNTSTWPQVGRSVAHLLSLKILPDDERDKSPTLSQYGSSTVYISSFFLSQRDMFESVLRVTGDKEEDWTITREDVVERYKRGQQLFKEGSMLGFGIFLYARNFYRDGSGDFNSKLDNNALGLPEEDLDEATKVAVKMALAGDTNAIH